MTRKVRRSFWVVLCLALLAALMVPAMAATGPAQTNNDGLHEYVYDRWARPVRSYLDQNEDGTFTRVEFTGSEVAVERYDSGFGFLEGDRIAMELPLFGGCYLGQDYNFLIFGQENPQEDDGVEVIRVVKYDKAWQRLGSAGLYGANTTVPFDAGSLRCVEYGGYLYIRTAHEMYTSDDGYNHQANLMMNVRIGDMVITDSYYDVMNISYGYVSHSFNQFVAVDGDDLLAVDHGDAYPRAVVLIRYAAPAGQDRFMQRNSDGDYVEAYNMLPIAGSVGANDTGVSLGGFQVSGSSYLVAGNTTAQEEEGYDPDGQRNIFVSSLTKDGSSRTIRYLTDYQEGDGVEISNPQFVKVGTDRFLVLWEVGSQLHYVFVDGTGAPVGQTYTATGRLSDCVPILCGDTVVWYVTNNSEPVFYTLDLTTNAVSAAIKLDTPQIQFCYSQLQTSVRVQWTTVEGAQGYQLYRTTTPEDPDSWKCVKTITSGSQNTYTNQGLTEGVTYYYKVRAFAGDEKRVYSEFSEMDFMPAAVVLDSPYSNSSFRIRVRWNEVDGAHGYQIWRQDEGGSYRVVKTIGDRGNELTQDMGSVTAYSNVGLTAGAKYTYKMRAFYITEDGGKVFGPFSDEVTVAVQPVAPEVTVVSPKAGRAAVSWTAAGGADGYQVWMSEAADSGFKIVKSVTDGETTAYTKSGLESGKTYYFKLRAYVEVDGKKTFGAYSQTVEVTVE